MIEDHKAHTQRPTNVRWLVFASACLTSWFLYLHRYSWAIAKGDIKAEFGLTDTELGWLDSAFLFGYAIFQIPTGHLGDVFGPALVLPIFIIGWSICVAGTGLGGGFWGFAGVRSLFGVAQAGTYPNLGTVTKSWFPASIRTTIQGAIASLSGRAGGACAALLVAGLLMGEMGMSWRWAFVVIGLAGTLFAVAFRFVYRDRPEDHPWVNEAERRLIRGDDNQKEQPVGRIAITGDRRARTSFGCFLLSQFTSAAGDSLFVYWLFLFLEEAKGLDKTTMGIYASLPLIGGAIGGFAGGALNDIMTRWTSRRVARSLIGFSGKLISAALIVASTFVEDGRLVMVVLAVAKFFTDWSQPTSWGTATDIAGKASGKIFGGLNMCGNIGAFIAGPVFGSIKGNFGWDPLFWTVAGIFTVSALCWPAVDCTKPIVVDKEPASTTSGHSEAER